MLKCKSSARPASLGKRLSKFAATSCLAIAVFGGSLASGLSSNALAEGRFLYIESNNHAAGENSIVAYIRAEDGTLMPHPKGPFLTKGAGINNDTNGKLGPNDNDTPIVVGPNKKRLFAVNGNSNTIAVFDIQSDGALEHVSGSPFASMGNGPVSLSISGNVLLVANRNEDPNQLAALRGSATSNYVSFRINTDGSLKYLSKIENRDGQKSSQIHVASAKSGIVFGNDFQVDVDFDDEGNVSKLFGDAAQVRGRLQSFNLDREGKLTQSDRVALTETAETAPAVPSVPLGIWDHPQKSLLYVGLVTRNQVGVYRYDDAGKLSFVSAVANSGQDVCWLRVNKAGTRLYAVNNLPRESEQDVASTITVFEIAGANAEKPVELSRVEIPLPLGTFINNRNSAQPNSTAFQFTLDEGEKYLYVINQRIDQTANNGSKEGNVLHTFRIEESGDLSFVKSRHLQDDGVNFAARPQGVVAVDIL